MFIHIGDQLVADIGSKKALLFHLKRLGKTKGMSKLKLNQLKAIYYAELRRVSYAQNCP